MEVGRLAVFYDARFQLHDVVLLLHGLGLLQENLVLDGLAENLDPAAIGNFRPLLQFDDLPSI